MYLLIMLFFLRISGPIPPNPNYKPTLVIDLRLDLEDITYILP